MAVTLHSEPTTPVNLIGDPFVFEFSMTDVNTATHIRRFGYQLFDANGQALSALELISPKEGENFYVDFQKDLKPFVSTEIPDCDVPFKLEADMVRFVYLKYWEDVFEKSSCDSTQENVIQTDDYRILNSSEQYYGKVNLPGSPTYLLTYKPKNLKICKDQCDFVYLWSLASHRFEVRAFFKDGSFAHSAPIDGNSEAWSYRVSPTDIAKAISPQYQGILNKLGKLEIYIDNVLWFQYHIVGCCDSEIIFFQQSGGGYSSIAFDEAQSTSMNAKGVEVSRYQPLPLKVNDKDRREQGGLSIANKKSYKTIKLTKVIRSDDAHSLRYYESFLSSGSYYHQFKSLEGYNAVTEESNLIKFLPNNGNLIYHKADDLHIMTITGKINQSHNMPNAQT